MSRHHRLVARPRIESLEGRAVMSALTPAELTGAYGLNANSYSSNGAAAKGDGSGQSIAIIVADHDANLAAELAAFDAQDGLSAPSLTVDDQAGSTTDAGWSQEEAMDVEWAHAAAPGAKLVVVEAASGGVADLVTAITTARSTPGVSVVSMSFGTPEFGSEASYDSLFTTPAGHTGITFLASSGDNGAGAQWPASSPNVVAVGGTSLTLDASGRIAAETAWAGSGGGASQYEPEPSYQDSAQSSGHRTTPDVALDADPNTGVSVYSVAAGGWIKAGGTSLACPVWAGLIAVADQGRALGGAGTLDGATQTLPALYAAPRGSFNDITAGSRATAGYDTATGLGSPNAPTLVAALVGNPAVDGGTMTTTTAPVSTTTTTTTTTPSPITTTPSPTTGGTATATAPSPTSTSVVTTAPVMTAPVAATGSHHKAARKKAAHSRHAQHNLVHAQGVEARAARPAIEVATTPAPVRAAAHQHQDLGRSHTAVDAVLAGWHRGRHARSAR